MKPDDPSLASLMTLSQKGDRQAYAALLLVRVALGGVFWRSGQTNIAEGAWFSISDTTVELFRTEYAQSRCRPNSRR